MAAAIELDVINGAANLNTGGPKQSCVHINFSIVLSCLLESIENSISNSVIFQIATL